MSNSLFVPSHVVEAVAAVTGVARLRLLCDPTHPDHNPGYYAVVRQLAAHHGIDPDGVPSDGAAAALYRRYGRADRIALPDGCGVVAGADHGQFPGLQLLLASLLLTHDVPVTVVDYGMTDDERAWLARQPVDVVPFPDGLFPHVDYWQAWVKPYAIGLAPYRRTLWLDNDILVEGDLTELFAAVESGPVVPRDYLQPVYYGNWNAPGLYDRYPTGAPLVENLCSGVVGLDRVRDAALLDSWAWLVSEAARDASVREMVAYWDQGALFWAGSKHGLVPVDRLDWNRPGRTIAEFSRRWPSPAALFGWLGPKRGTVVHFQARPKPYGWDGVLDVELSVPPLSVAVLGHNPDNLAALPLRPFLRPVNLNATGLSNDYAESRAFLTMTDADVDAMPDYVGFATCSWDAKYRETALPLAELHRVGPLLRPDRVICAERAPHNWPDWTASQNPGLLPYIERLREWAPPARTGEAWPSLWSHNFVCHRDVFREFLQFFRGIHARIVAEWGTDPDGFDYDPVDRRRPLSFLYEAIGCVYWESRADLELCTTQGVVEPTWVLPPLPPTRERGVYHDLPHWGDSQFGIVAAGDEALAHYRAGRALKAAYDFDGVICADPPRDVFSDPGRYTAWLADAPPLVLPTGAPLPLVVTGRDESRRDVTLAWLKRHGVRVDRLVMRDFDAPADDAGWHAAVGKWKAKHYKDSGLPLFIESDPTQSQAIADAAGLAVLCQSLGRAVVPAPPKPSSIDWTAIRAVNACPHRGCRTGCQAAKCSANRGDFAGGSEASMGHCLKCVTSQCEQSAA